MGSTGKGFRYPQYSDTPDIPRDLTYLAEDVDSYLDAHPGPQGTTGSQGALGTQGATGTQGTTGTQGATGAEGAQGAQGTTGAQGLEGSQGTYGTQGTSGAQGTAGSGVDILGSYPDLSSLQSAHPTGNLGDAYVVSGDLYVWTGSSWTNVGPIQGPQGTTGSQGSVGAQGTIGSQGLAGTQGANGTQGALGTQGSQGEVGAQGATGTQGAIGTQGSTGTQGAQGSTGAQGTTGVQGTSGVQGATGAQGTIGSEGPATVPQNSQTSSYTLVSSDNGKFISITTGGVTVPGSVFSVGQNVVIYNNSSSSQTITQGSGVTMRFASFTTTGNRTIPRYGLATILCVDSNTFVISGPGLS